MTKPVIILGGGGHAKVLADSLLCTGHQIIGFTDPGDNATLSDVIAHLGSDETVFEHHPGEIKLVNGLGSTADTTARRNLFSTFAEKGYQFADVTHPSAVVSHMGVKTGHGNQILAGVVINPGTRLGDNIIINSGAVVEHDCHIGDHVHISPGAVVCGDCRVGDGTHIGAGAVIIQGIEIGHGTVVAAGSVVTTNVEPLTLVAGVPAKAKRGKT